MRKNLILNCAKAIFSAYRSDQYVNHDSFVTQLATVLEQFPDEVIRYVADPRTGIQRRSQWPPSIAEVVKACEDHEDYLARVRKPRQQRLEEPPTDPEMKRRVDALFADLVAKLKNGTTPSGVYRAELTGPRVFIPTTDHRYERFAQWSQTAPTGCWKFGQSSDGRDGIWVAWDVWNNNPRAA